MTTELVRVTTELQPVQTLDYSVPNKHVLIAALRKIGAACGAPAHEVSQMIDALERWQREDYTAHLLRRWSIKGRIAENASFSEWHLPTYYEKRSKQLPAWAEDLHFRVEKPNGQIMLRDVRYKGLAYADFANALGVSPEQPANGYLVRMTLHRVHESWCFGKGTVLPLRPLMDVLNWFFEEPEVTMTEDERRQYAQEHDMVLDELKLDPWQDEYDVAPYGDYLEFERDLGEYMRRRFSGDEWGKQIHFAESAERKERKHPHLWADGFWASMNLVHPTAAGVSVGCSDPNIDNFACGSGESLLDVHPPLYGYWDSSDYIEDLAVVQLTCGFSAVPPHTLAQKQELQRCADEFAAKLRECFEPVMQTMQSALYEED